MDTVIRADRLFDGTGAAAVERAVVVVRDGRIVAAGREGEVEVPAGAPAVEHPGCTILPGLIDSHVHLVFSSGPTPLADFLAEDDRAILLRAAHAAQVALRAGITTVKDLGDRGGTAVKLRNEIARGLLPGARVVAAGPAITITGGHCNWLGGEADTADDLRKKARQLHKEGVDLFKVMASGGRMTPSSNVLASQYRPEELLALVEEARRLNKTVASHAHAASAVRESVAAGVDVIEHCTWLSATDGTQVDYDPKVAEQMARQGTFLDPTLSTQAAYLNRPEAELTPGQRETRAARARVLECHRRTIELGVEVCAGTDAGATNVPLDSLPNELRLLQSELGLSPAQAMRAATLNGARALKLEHDLGTVRPGRRADLLVVRGDPLDDLGALANVRAVYKDGVLEVEDGRLVRC